MNLKENDKLRHALTIGLLLMVCGAPLVGCQPPQPTSFHELTLVDQHHRGRFQQLGVPEIGPDWYYTGTEEDNHVIVMRDLGRSGENIYFVPKSELRIDQEMPRTDKRIKWRKINHKIRTILR